MLFASYGGHRFGPRYWFFAWPTAMLTIATGLTTDRDWLRLPRLRLHLPTLAALHLPLYAGTAITIACFNSQYIAARRAVYAATPPRTPAIILIPTRMLPVSRFETSPARAGSADFARNNLDFTNPVLYGRADDSGTHQSLYIPRLRPKPPPLHLAAARHAAGNRVRALGEGRPGALPLDPAKGYSP